MRGNSKKEGIYLVFLLQIKVQAIKISMRKMKSKVLKSIRKIQELFNLETKKSSKYEGNQYIFSYVILGNKKIISS